MASRDGFAGHEIYVSIIYVYVLAAMSQLYLRSANRNLASSFSSSRSCGVRAAVSSGL